MRLFNVFCDSTAIVVTQPSTFSVESFIHNKTVKNASALGIFLKKKKKYRMVPTALKAFFRHSKQRQDTIVIMKKIL